MNIKIRMCPLNTPSSYERQFCIFKNIQIDYLQSMTKYVVLNTVFTYRTFRFPRESKRAGGLRYSGTTH